MNDIEQRLRELKLKEPSQELDDAVIDLVRNQSPQRSVPLHWAVAAALIIGIISFYSGLQWQMDQSQSTQEPAKIQVYIIDRSGENPFDITQSLSQFHDGEVEVKTIPLKGNDI